jgi:hypothetical protein
MSEQQEVNILSVEDVNQRLPLVRSIIRDVMGLHQDLQRRQQRLQELRRRYPAQSVPEDDSVYEQEVRQMESELVSDHDRMGEFQRELQEIGGRLSNAEQGTVDFRGEISGEPVWYCWNVGESTVQYWHRDECGGENRRHLETETTAAQASEFGQSC